jgi:hypothetical protein
METAAAADWSWEGVVQARTRLAALEPLQSSLATLGCLLAAD